MHYKIFTIGVYGYNENEFLSKLIDNNIDTFIDIRMRRGMRGSKYSFANSKYLQDKLMAIGIKYLYCIELAPTKAIREIQKKIDQEKQINKSQRKELSIEFTEEYKKNILCKYDFNCLFSELDNSSKRVVFFCVERESSACHRSIVASYLEKNYGMEVQHL